MTNYLLSIDPGKSTGIVLLGYQTDSDPWIGGVWQVSPSLQGFRGWWRDHTEYGYGSLEEWRLGDARFDGYLSGVTVIAEKFTARNTQGFSYTTESLAALPVEGVLIWEGLMPDYTPKEKRWVDPKFQYLVGGKDLADKKKRQHAFLEATGFYIGRKEIGETLPDYNDARSATAHGIAYLARVAKHRPSWDLIEGWASEH